MNPRLNSALVIVSVWALAPGAVADPPARDGDTGHSSVVAVAGGLNNDDCADPLFVGQVQTPFSSIGATTDGADEPETCDFQGYTHIDSDVWFCYAAECEDEVGRDAFVSISVCGSEYDTKLAVYRGCGCPTEQPLACSDNDCEPSSRQSRVVVDVTTRGEQFMIRVGGFLGDQGTGILNIFCGHQDDFPACAEHAGACTEPNSSRACDDTDCCRSVCELDPRCCDVEWNASCVAIAASLCGTGSENCGLTGDFDGDGQSTIIDYGFFVACVADSSPGSLAPGCSAFDFNADDAVNVFDFGGLQVMFGTVRGACSVAHDSPGCSTQSCCQAVCKDDPDCCLVAWDQSCANEASSAISCACTADAGECDTSNGTVGCNDETCCLAVCAEDSLCCSVDWDEFCADLATEFCGE